MNNLSYRVIKGLMVQCHDDAYIYASKGYAIYRRHKDEKNFKYLASIKQPFLRNLLVKNRMISRILRLGIRRLIFSEKGLMAIIKNDLYLFEIESKKQSKVHSFELGAPIDITYVKKHDKFYYGTYHSGGSDKPIGIYSSSDLINWECIYQFPIGSVRHIHGIFFQESEDRLYAATGDTDEESKVIYSNDYFKNHKILVSGTQMARIVNMIFRNDEAILFTDSPNTQNYVYKVPTSKESLQKYQISSGHKIDGPCFNVAERDEDIYFSTVAERSEINDDINVAIYKINNKNELTKIFSFERDLKFLRKLRPYFMHPTFRVVAPPFCDIIYLSGVGLKKCDGSTLYFDSKHFK